MNDNERREDVFEGADDVDEHDSLDDLDEGDDDEDEWDAYADIEGDGAHERARPRSFREREPGPRTRPRRPERRPPPHRSDDAHRSDDD